MGRSARCTGYGLCRCSQGSQGNIKRLSRQHRKSVPAKVKQESESQKSRTCRPPGGAAPPLSYRARNVRIDRIPCRGYYMFARFCPSCTSWRQASASLPGLAESAEAWGTDRTALRSLLAAAVAVALAPEAASFIAPSAGVVRSGVAARAACSRAPGLRMQAVDDKTEVRCRSTLAGGRPSAQQKLR